MKIHLKLLFSGAQYAIFGQAHIHKISRTSTCLPIHNASSSKDRVSGSIFLTAPPHQNPIEPMDLEELDPKKSHISLWDQGPVPNGLLLDPVDLEIS